MVQVNGTEFKIYSLDTDKTIIERIAETLNTIPKYLYFQEGKKQTIDKLKKYIEQKQGEEDEDEEEKEEYNISVQNMIDIVKKESTEYNFQKFYEQVKQEVTQLQLPLKDIVSLYLMFNTGIEEIPKGYENPIIDLIHDNIMKSEVVKEHNENNPLDKINILYIQRDKDGKLTELKENIKANKNKARKDVKVYKEFDTVENTSISTPFELEKVSFEVSIKIENISIMEIFNRLRLSPVIPFATINNFYKVLDDFIPPESWSITLENTIIIKISEKINVINTKLSDYTDTFVYFDEENPSMLKISMDISSKGNHISREEYVRRFLSSIASSFAQSTTPAASTSLAISRGEIPNTLDPVSKTILDSLDDRNISETKVSGVYYIPNQSLNKYVFADLAMNNSLFSSLLVIDEFDKASKKKTSIYNYFYTLETGYISANLTPKITEKGSLFLKGKDRKLFPDDSEYIRVKIGKAKDINAVNQFQNIFGKLLTIYNNEYKNIVKLYRKYIQTFATEEDEDIQKVKEAKKDYRKLKLKDIAPEIFAVNYPRKCAHAPTIISDEQAEIEKEAGRDVMVFPREDSGLTQRNYICEHEKHKYPGLLENKLENKDVIPYLPCCYGQNQATNAGSKYRKYFYGEEEKEKSTVMQGMIRTDKIVVQDGFGTLPESISKMFDIFEENEDCIFIRKGVFRNKNNFINCVMEALHEETKILDITDEKDRNVVINKLRKSLATTKFAAACKQEMYDYSIDEIINIIKSPDQYFDPKYFVTLLEKRFKCNIFVFSKIGSDGALVLPRHIKGFYKRKNMGRCIFIYEHMGSESDNAKYPQCELIVKWNTKARNDLYYSFPYDSTNSKGVIAIFEKMRTFYIKNTLVKETIFPIINKEIKLVSQKVDTYGKCRLINAEYKGLIYTIFTSPIQPYAIPLINEYNEEENKIHTSSLVDTMKFAKEIKMNIQTQTTDGVAVKEISGTSGNVYITIPVKDSPIIEELPVTSRYLSKYDTVLKRQVSDTQEEVISHGSDINTLSIMRKFNKFKKLSRCLIEYMLWLFSIYINENNITRLSEMNDDIILQFVRKKMQIIPNFSYGTLYKTFDLNSPALIKDGKLVITSKEALRRLLFVLRLNIRRYFGKILTYHNNKMIDNFYVDITDFDHIPFQILMEGKQSVSKWIVEQKNQINELYKEIQFDKIFPYFLQIDFIGNEIFLAQNTDSLDRALDILRKWYIDGYNPGYTNEEYVVKTNSIEEDIRGLTYIKGEIEEKEKKKTKSLILVSEESDNEEEEGSKDEEGEGEEGEDDNSDDEEKNKRKKGKKTKATSEESTSSTKSSIKSSTKSVSSKSDETSNLGWDVTFTLYSYSSPTDIEIYTVIGKEKAYDVRVIGYKKDKKVYYTSIMMI